MEIGVIIAMAPLLVFQKHMLSFIYLRSEIFYNSPPNNVVCSYCVELSASVISLMEYIVVSLVPISLLHTLWNI